MPAASPAAARAPSPVRAFAAAPTRTRTCGATRKRASLSSRHERACAPVSKLRCQGNRATVRRRLNGRSRESARPRSGSLRVRRRRANHCDMAKSRLREKPRSLFVPRRKALQAFVSAPRGFRADAIASRPEGLTVAGRRRVKPSGLRRGDGSPRSVAVRRGRGSRRFVFCGVAAEPKAGASAVRSRRADVQDRPLSRGKSPGRVQEGLEMFFGPH